MAGYSNTPLYKKLGYKPGFKSCIINSPENYLEELGNIGKGIEFHNKLVGIFNFIHFFTTSKKDLINTMPKLKKALERDGILWLSWPKISSGLKTDLRESDVQKIGLGSGLVDIKVAAIDDIWSGLKFVYRIKDR